MHYVQEKLSPESAETPNEDTSDREPDGVFSTAPDDKAEAVIDDSMPNNTSFRSHFLFTAPIDPVHEEAFSILKKLQVLKNFELWPTMI